MVGMPGDQACYSLVERYSIVCNFYNVEQMLLAKTVQEPWTLVINWRLEVEEKEKGDAGVGQYFSTNKLLMKNMVTKEDTALDIVR